MFSVLSKLQYRNKNQNYISNFIFQFIKKKNKTKWHFGNTDYVNLHVHDFTFYCNFHSNCYENLNHEILNESLNAI